MNDIVTDTNNPTDGETETTEHILTIVEPTRRGDGTLDVAHDVVARGGRASVVMVITERVNADIREYAASENLSRGEAEMLAVGRLADYCRERIGDQGTTIVERFGPLGRLGTDIRRYITDDITAVALPESLVGRRGADRVARKLGRPVVVSPEHAA